MSRKKPTIGKNYFFARDSGRYYRIDFWRIRYIEVRRNYCRIDTTEKVRKVLIGLGKLEKILPPDDFCRIHRSYIVGLAHIEWFDKQVVHVADQNLPIGEEHRKELPRRVLRVPPVARGIRVPVTKKRIARL
jgi:two-component system, LytTR family, response regulator